MTRAAKPLRFALLAAAAATLAGCSSLTPDWLEFSDAADAQGATMRVEDRHPIKVRQSHRILEIPLQIAGRADARRAVANFAHAHAATGETPIQVSYPKDGGARARDAAQNAIVVLRAAGARDDAIVSGPYDPAQARRTGLVLSFMAPRAFSAGCPRDPGDPTRDNRNRTAERFGCADQHNLASMIARPRDLVGPRPATPAFQPRRDTVIGAYAAGEATNAKQTVEETKTTKF